MKISPDVGMAEWVQKFQQDTFMDTVLGLVPGTCCGPQTEEKGTQV